MSILELKASDLPEVCNFVMNSCGIALDESKDYLIEDSLNELCQELDLNSYRDLVALAKTELALTTRIVDAITTNETSFFRDESPFGALQNKAIPEMIDSKQGTPHSKRLRIWSAACSTGQEAYSIAMTLCELIPDIEEWDVKILGSDVSPAVVKRASRGIYLPLEIERGLSADRLRTHFSQTTDGWQVCDKVRSLCSFEQRDLTKPHVGIGPFDIVFCRNIAIYFTATGRELLFQRVMNNLSAGGYLFAGSSECLSDLGYTPQHHCRSHFYRQQS